MARGDGSRGEGRAGASWRTVDVGSFDRATLEETVYDLYDAEGYDVEWAAPSAEGDVVLVARRSRLVRSALTTVVSVATAGTSVTPGSVDRLDYARGMNGADRAALVTTASVDGPTRDAADGTKVSVVDGEAFRGRLADSDLAPP